MVTPPFEVPRANLLRALRGPATEPNILSRLRSVPSPDGAAYSEALKERPDDHILLNSTKPGRTHESIDFDALATRRAGWTPAQSYRDVVVAAGKPDALLVDIDSTVVDTEPLHDEGHVCAARILHAMTMGRTLSADELQREFPEFSAKLLTQEVTKHHADGTACSNAVALGLRLGVWRGDSTELVASYSRLKAASMIQAVSKDFPPVISSLLPEQELAALQQTLGRGWYQLKVVPEMDKILRTAKEAGIPVVACTGGATSTFLHNMKAVGLADCFTGYFTSDDLTRNKLKGKPDPASFSGGINILRELGHLPTTAPAKIWCFEDRPSGAQSAASALAKHAFGLECFVWVCRTGWSGSSTTAATSYAEHGSSLRSLRDAANNARTFGAMVRSKPTSSLLRPNVVMHPFLVSKDEGFAEALSALRAVL